MAIRRIFSCQTICQKSSTVFIFGPIICRYFLKNCYKVKSYLHNKYNDTLIISFKCQYTLWCNVYLFTKCILKENVCICRGFSFQRWYSFKFFIMCVGEKSVHSYTCQNKYCQNVNSHLLVHSIYLISQHTFLTSGNNFMTSRHNSMTSWHTYLTSRHNCLKSSFQTIMLTFPMLCRLVRKFSRLVR